MPSLLRYTPERKIEAKLGGESNFTILSDRNITIADFQFRVVHILEVLGNGRLNAYWLMDKLTMLQYTTKEALDSGRCGNNGRGSKVIRVFHNAPHLLRSEVYPNGGGMRHLDLQGNAYGGCNTASGGSLCLGAAWSPYNLSPVELFVNSRPNNDMGGWYGSYAEVKKLNGTQKVVHGTSHRIYDLYEITSWQPSGHAVKLPREISGFFEV